MLTCALVWYTNYRKFIENLLRIIENSLSYRHKIRQIKLIVIKIKKSRLNNNYDSLENLYDLFELYLLVRMRAIDSKICLV